MESHPRFELISTVYLHIVLIHTSFIYMRKCCPKSIKRRLIAFSGRVCYVFLRNIVTLILTSVE